jgi:hypothetical protein
MAYHGSLPAGDGAGSVRISLVKSTLNPTTVTYTIDGTQYTDSANMPCRPCNNGAPDTETINGIVYSTETQCASATTAAHALLAGGADASGVYTITNTFTEVDVDTTGLNTGTITGNTYTPTEFAVCFTEAAGNAANWKDSGIRVTISKMSQISHGTPVNTGGDVSRVMVPVLSTMLTSGLSSTDNVIPQVVNQQVTYSSAPTSGEALGNTRYLSLVEASVNTYKPCARGVDAAAAADSTHTGAVIAATGTQTVTLPRTDQLDYTKTFAVCYAITDGTTTDASWADSYIRVTISQVQALSSIDVTHSVTTYTGHLAYRDASQMLDVTATGSLAANKYIALVDATLGTTKAGFPCLDAAVAAASEDSAHTGSLTASGSTWLVKTSTLSATITFVACYSLIRQHGTILASDLNGQQSPACSFPVAIQDTSGNRTVSSWRLTGSPRWLVRSSRMLTTTILGTISTSQL